VLELGPASLIFSRNGTTGKLILVIGDQPPRDLPITFPLDADGRSLNPLTVNFSRSPDGLSVVSGNQKLQFSADPAAGPTTEIVASSGTSQPWSIQSLFVTVGSVDPVRLPKSAAGLAPNSTVPTLDAADLSVGGSGPTPADLISAALAAQNGQTPKASAASADAITFEIYTPPAVRHGRTTAVRAAAQGTASN
jgi:hypothetical protein